MKKSRFLLVLTVLLVFGLVTAQCGGGAAQPAPSGEQKSAETPAGESAESESGLAPELSVYNWADYIDESLLTKYQEEYGVKIIYDTFASNEDLLAKMQAGATGYDVIFPSEYMVAQMIELGLLAEIDKNNISNIKNLDPRFMDAPHDPGNKYCLPYQWGTTGIVYSTEFFTDETPDSWAYLFDPAMAQKWADAGGINLLNDQRELIGAALKYQGYSINDTDEAHLQQAKDLILAIKPYVKTFNSEGYREELLVPGEVVISHAWSGDAFLTIDQTYDETTEESEWAYVIPKEGAVIFQDNMCIPATSQHQATAEHFINFLLDAENGAAITNFTFYGSPNKAAEEFILPEILEDPSIYPPPEVMDKLEFIAPVGETVFVYDRLWTEIKSQ
ncbi:MAG: spermidine/putrescine ABC transporter substrate-binding protein [Chloroflexota bacterium]